MAKKKEKPVEEEKILEEQEVTEEVKEEEIPVEVVEAENPEVVKLKDQLSRLSADFDNFRKRTAKEKEEMAQYAASNIIGKLLIVLDNFDHAENALNNVSEESQKVGEGFLMIKKQLIDVLGEEGLKEMDCLGRPFDPNFHEAFMQMAAEEGQNDQEIVQVMRKGYMYKDKVIRAAAVAVATK